MSQATWKKWLSYIYPIHLESETSEYNEHLHVVLSRGRYQLQTEKAVYSYDDLYINFAIAFDELNIRKINPKKVLVLGLGLGSVPFMLEKKYNLQAEYTTVEIDDAVIYLANKYSLSQVKSPINFICTDAEAYVNLCQEKYDLICMDIFNDDFIPPQFETKEYLSQLKNLLSENGLLLYNRLSLTKNDLLKTQKFQEKFNGIFPDGYHIDAKGNWILVGN